VQTSPGKLDIDRPYGELTVEQRFRWHARIYAFRRIVLKIERSVRTSPVDPTGQWFRDDLVADAERALRAKFAGRRGR